MSKASEVAHYDSVRRADNVLTGIFTGTTLAGGAAYLREAGIIFKNWQGIVIDKPWKAAVLAGGSLVLAVGFGIAAHKAKNKADDIAYGSRNTSRRYR